MTVVHLSLVTIGCRRKLITIVLLLEASIQYLRTISEMPPWLGRENCSRLFSISSDVTASWTVLRSYLQAVPELMGAAKHFRWLLLKTGGTMDQTGKFSIFCILGGKISVLIPHCGI